jgi:hypothetical protein
MRHTHHLLAQTLAKGECEANASLITGYSLSYISVLKGDPAFRELLATYHTERELVFVDVLERMKGLGLATMEEIQSRLEISPEKFTNRELQELTKMLLVDSGQAGGRGASAAGTAGGVNVQISFVQANHQPPQAPAGPTIDGLAKRVEEAGNDW